jgi:hypothetical protein
MAGPTGRFLAILGYLDTCVAMVVLNRFILAALGTDDADASQQVVLRGWWSARWSASQAW